MLADFDYKEYQDIMVDNCEKVLIVNFETDTYRPIKIDDKDKDRPRGMNHWFIEFANSNSVSEKDRKRFLDFANVETIKEELRRNNRVSIVYRRKPERWCIMSAFRTDKEDEALLIVIDIQNVYMNAISRNNDKEFGDKDDLFTYVEGLRGDAASCGIVMFELNEAEEILKTLAYYYPYSNAFTYDNTHVAMVTRDLTAGEFQVRIASAYKYFNKYDVVIGSSWQDDDWNTNHLIAKAITNLQINKGKKEIDEDE